MRRRRALACSRRRSPVSSPSARAAATTTTKPPTPAGLEGIWDVSLVVGVRRRRSRGRHHRSPTGDTYVETLGVRGLRRAGLHPAPARGRVPVRRPRRAVRVGASATAPVSTAAASSGSWARAAARCPPPVEGGDASPCDGIRRPARGRCASSSMSATACSRARRSAPRSRCEPTARVLRRRPARLRPHAGALGHARPGSLAAPCAESSPWCGVPPTASPRHPTSSARWSTRRVDGAVAAGLDVRALVDAAVSLEDADRLLRGVPGRAVPARPPPTWSAAVDAAVDRLWSRSPRSRPRLDGGRASRAGPRGDQRRRPPIKDARLGGPARPPPHRPPRRRAGGARRRSGRHRGVHVGPGRAVGPRPPRGPRPRLRRPAPARRATTASTSTRRRATPCSTTAAGRRPVPQRRRPHAGRARSASSTRRPPRSASWATTRGRSAPPSPPTSCCASRSGRPTPRSSSSATPGGRASASSARPTPTR